MTILAVLFLYLPFRISRGFPMIARTGFTMIVLAKAILLVIIHVWHVDATGHPIVLDTSVDAKRYYDFGTAFLNYHPLDISYNDMIRERGASAHLGYYVVNLIAFKTCPDYPILFLRLAKLLLFHVALGMLATTWRIMTNATRATVAYLVLGLVFYQFCYYTFRNLKDDLILSVFMMLMAVADRTVAVEHKGHLVSFKKMMGSWIIISLLIAVLCSLRLYLGLALVCAFAMHTLTGRGLKVAYRVLFAGVVAVGFLAIAGSEGFNMVRERGGPTVVLGALGNVYGLFKVFVTPLPWQHGTRMLAFPHTFYLFLLAPALWAFLVRVHRNLNWKLYLVALLALVLGGYMQDFEPRKRYCMYPIFVSWIVMVKRRESVTEPVEQEPFDPDAYFAKESIAYT